VAVVVARATTTAGRATAPRVPRGSNRCRPSASAGG
jgi:hypothetical protein